MNSIFIVFTKTFSNTSLSVSQMRFNPLQRAILIIVFGFFSVTTFASEKVEVISEAELQLPPKTFSENPIVDFSLYVSSKISDTVYRIFYAPSKKEDFATVCTFETKPRLEVKSTVPTHTAIYTLEGNLDYKKFGLDLLTKLQ
ncbi:hypothetical protein [Aequorivita echinoideorum]|uniref:Uncharacterized protein n=1 Tax=Aequorivita echinoideorum TaxID=1549647 RepID=A0ABS5S2Y1_9FLAO|nr:hypothetical protein [Aequorivita echinoideorum]MBT0607576.1 hypothetical protein [Aequorivita echinoideorum]